MTLESILLALFIIGVLVWIAYGIRCLIKPALLQPTFTQADYEIKDQLCTLLFQVGFGSDVLGIVGSWKDTLEDEDILNQLQHLSDSIDANGLRRYLLQTSDTAKALTFMHIFNNTAAGIGKSPAQLIDLTVKSINDLYKRNACSAYTMSKMRELVDSKTNNGGC